MATPVDVQGTLFQRGNAASPEVFATVGLVPTVPESNPARDMRDITAINDTQFQFSPGMLRGGTPAVTFRYAKDDASHAGFVTDFGAKTARNYKLVLPTSPATTIAFRAYVSGYSGPSGAPNDLLQMTVNLQLISGPTWS